MKANNCQRTTKCTTWVLSWMRTMCSRWEEATTFISSPFIQTSNNHSQWTSYHRTDNCQMSWKGQSSRKGPHHEWDTIQWQLDPKKVASFTSVCFVVDKRDPWKDKKWETSLQKDLNTLHPSHIVDVFCPFITKQAQKEHKRYGLHASTVFTCSSCWNVRRPINRHFYKWTLMLYCFTVRGSVRQTKYDQGTNFIGAKNELNAGQMDTDSLTTFLAEKQCNFVLNTTKH